ncbi:uncharacterized protein LOC133314612 [Gastrolobium bilobum]|uniref:uncharacterized protein LOC133314612 n=1 Tax=Gastrolobium bilobum TaxID=150636 RepID=UPI002AB2284B|nr:uncharacterized protein LOC133314612 [Gastrolobium bilobum]XP_061372096.1 uncharacterized protein LOC133314612 [Gastrolobium bilobum]
MKTRGTSTSGSGKSHVSEGGGEQIGNDSVAFGDVIFIRLRSGTWWPAQVVDDNSVNESIKPGKRSPGEVLVRIYGSYTYSYADPIKCRSEFEVILKHNGGSLKNILQQALEQDLPSTKSRRSKGSSKGTSSKSSASKRKSYRQDEEQNKVKGRKQNESLNDDDLGSQSHETNSLGKPRELSARRMRVMENLGLIAPRGSPFHKVGQIIKARDYRNGGIMGGRS